MFRNNNPDKGTETGEHKYEKETYKEFRNNNPDKGTETKKQRILLHLPLRV